MDNKKNVHTFVGIRNEKKMKILTTREIVKNTKAVFELAETENVLVKRGSNKYIRLIVTDNPDSKFVTDKWIDEFMAIPEKYRCNPFDISPSGDLFYADKRNVEQLEEAMRQAKEGKMIRIKTKEELDSLLYSL